MIFDAFIAWSCRLSVFESCWKKYCQFRVNVHISTLSFVTNRHQRIGCTCMRSTNESQWFTELEIECQILGVAFAFRVTTCIQISGPCEICLTSVWYYGELDQLICASSTTQAWWIIRVKRPCCLSINTFYRERSGGAGGVFSPCVQYLWSWPASGLAPAWRSPERKKVLEKC
jgi:hypothetical protein